MNALTNDINKIIIEAAKYKNTDYAIRYIVVSISRIVQRDLKFFSLPQEKKLELLEKNQLPEIPYVICKTLCEVIKDSLSKIGIESKIIISTNSYIPLYALIVDGENSRYYIDPLHDLFRSQYRIMPVAYGTHIRSNTSLINEHSGLTDLPLEQIREIDLKTGLIEEQYFSDYITCIQNAFTNRNKAKKIFDGKIGVDAIDAKLNHISDKYINLYPVNGPMERVGLYVYLRTHLFNKSEKRKFYVFNDEDGNVKLYIEYGEHILTYEEYKDKDIYILRKH